MTGKIYKLRTAQVLGGYRKQHYKAIKDSSRTIRGDNIFPETHTRKNLTQPFFKVQTRRTKTPPARRMRERLDTALRNDDINHNHTTHVTKAGEEGERGIYLVACQGVVKKGGLGRAGGCWGA